MRKQPLADIPAAKIGRSNIILLSDSGRNRLQDDEIFCEWKTQCRVGDSEKNEGGITEQILFNARSLAGYQNKLPRGLTCMIEFSNPYVDSISKSLFRNGQVNPHGIECSAQFINTVSAFVNRDGVTLGVVHEQGATTVALEAGVRRPRPALARFWYRRRSRVAVCLHPRAGAANGCSSRRFRARTSCVRTPCSV